MYPGNRWKHVFIAFNEQTMRMDVVLKYPHCAPIGPRLQKGLTMPADKPTGWVMPDDAMKVADAFDKWLTDQEAGKRDGAGKPPGHDHYGIKQAENGVEQPQECIKEPQNESKPPLDGPKPAPEPIKPAPAPVQKPAKKPAPRDEFDF